MRILQAGLDKITLAFLHDGGFSIEDTGPISDTEDLMSWVTAGNYSVVVIDLSAVKFGIYAARHLRNKKFDIPVVGISLGSADHTWSEERAIFLENGGDDLLRGPANPRELAASLRAVSRRFSGAAVSIVEFKYGAAVLKVNQTTRTVFINGREPELTKSERDILLHFADNPGRTLSKEILADNLYSLRPDDPPEIKIIDVFVCKLRKKLERVHPDAEKLIETVWGKGYRLVSQAVQAAA
jgi:two-component system cell cycle response regulator CtrA